MENIKVGDYVVKKEDQNEKIRHHYLVVGAFNGPSASKPSLCLERQGDDHVIYERQELYTKYKCTFEKGDLLVKISEMSDKCYGSLHERDFHFYEVHRVSPSDYIGDADLVIKDLDDNITHYAKSTDYRFFCKKHEKRPRYKVGDHVIGTSDRYSITCLGWKGVVTEVIDHDEDWYKRHPYEENDIKVRGLYHDSKINLEVSGYYFELDPEFSKSFNVGDIVRAVCDTRSISNYNIKAGSIWYVRAIDHNDRDGYDIRINEFDTDNIIHSSYSYGVWVNSAAFEIYEMPEPEFSRPFNVGDIVRAIHNTKSSSNYIIETGSIWRVRAIDGYKIRISEVDGDTHYKYDGVWASGKHFEICKICEIKEKKDMITKFKIGDYVTAKETFCYDGEKIVKGHQYEVSDCSRKDCGWIQIDLGPRYWWVPKDKMTPISSSGSVYTGTEVMLKIKDVIYSNPATIVFWDDGSKTVVRCGKGETFDPEKGLAMAISKRVLGSNYAWHGRFNKWLPKNRAEKKDKSKKTKEETPNE